MSVFHQLLDFLSKLEAARIHYTLGHFRDETIMVTITVPGERWEVEFFADGSTEVEIFRSAGDILSGSEASDALGRLFSTHSD